MAKIVNSSTALINTIDFGALGKFKDWLFLLKDDAFERASIVLQEETFVVMANKYLSTKSNRIYYNKKYLSKSGDKSIEKRLFESKLPIPVRKGQNTIQIKFWEGYSKLSRDLPHLKWQEEGTKAMVDVQPYEIQSIKALGPITKRRASKRKRTIRKEFYHIKDIGRVVDINVPHPGLPGRKFIAAGNSFIKRNGARIIKEFISNEIDKAIGAK